MSWVQGIICRARNLFRGKQVSIKLECVSAMEAMSMKVSE